MNIFMDQDLNVQVVLGGVNSLGINLIHQEARIAVEGNTSSAVIGGGSGEISGDISGDIGGNMYGDMTGTTTKDPLLSSLPFVLGISSATLVVGIVLGVLLAKRKIKKGFELYED